MDAELSQGLWTWIQDPQSLKDKDNEEGGSQSVNTSYQEWHE